MSDRRQKSTSSRRNHHHLRYHRLPLHLVRLEDRAMPSAAAFMPPSHYQFNTTLSALNVKENPQDIALSYLNQHATDLGITAADLVNPIITNQFTDDDSGITHLYIRQSARGLPVANADFAVGIAANGAVISVGGGFVYDLTNKLAAAPAAGFVMTPIDAVRSAGSELGLTIETDPVFVNPIIGPVQMHTISALDISLDDIPANLQYVPTADGSAALAWHLVVRTPDNQHWYDLSVDAFSGTLMELVDWNDDEAAYINVPLPNESVQDGGFAISENPANSTASPFGWHDTNGAVGAEFTDTRGNNVDAHLDRNNDNVADASPVRPNGSSALDFSGFAFDASESPSTLGNENAAVVNLFNMNNVLHDIHYQYGFTEAAGNFQVNNYGKGGKGNDAVQADAQDGGDTNNANFGTPTDGSAPRMQMYEWTSTTPSRDSDLDNGIIIHEYGHGVSNRLTGGAANSNALNNIQSGGMGEGWGDFWALMLTQRSTDIQNGGFGIGTYVVGQSQSGGGIRRKPYSYNMGIDPLTFDAYGTSGTTTYGVTKSTEVHNSGELWASTLWDMNWLLINKYGYDPNLYTGWTATAGPGHAGNKLTLRLVMEGLKLQPTNPSFIQARDAILAADIALNGGQDLFEIWSAFARRGLGVLAATSSSSATTITTDTSTPMLVASVVPATGAVVTSHPASYGLNVSNPINPLTLDAADFIVNGQPADAVIYVPGSTSATFTFISDPVTSQGVQTISINAGAFTRATDSAPVSGFSSTFYYDATPLQVVSFAPAPNTTFAPPMTTLDVNLNQPIDPASVQTSDLGLSRGSVTSFSLLNGNTTVRFALASLTLEGKVSASVALGAFADLDGNPNKAFTGSYTLDYSTLPFTTPLVARVPLGSLIYDGTSGANIGFAGDTDSFTLKVDAGQTLNVIVTPTPSLRPTLSITGGVLLPLVTAPAAGEVAQMQLIPNTSLQTLTITVGGANATVGNFTVQVVTNTANEAEANGGAANGTIATAQDLSASLLDLGNGVGRMAVRGRSDAAVSNETEPNNTTATATLVTTAGSLPTNLYQLGISGTISSTTDSDYFNLGPMQPGDIITISESGSHSLRGTMTDPRVRLYRSGTGTTQVTDDDDGGPHDANGGDSLLYRFTITTADTYIVRASRFQTSVTGSYQLGIYLENTSTAPSTGGIFTTEAEPNDTVTSSNNAATSWRPVKYVLSTAGSITAGDNDFYQYQFLAGDVVTFVSRSTSSLAPQSFLVNSTGATLATEDGTSLVAGAGGFSPIYSYNIPTTGAYYLRVAGAGGSTGSYVADAYVSTSATTPPLTPPGKDLYAFDVLADQSASLTINALAAGNLDIAVLDDTGAVVATGTAGATNISEIVSNFTPSVAGTYYAQVTGTANIDYELLIVTGGTFDAEANDTFATAQPLGDSRAALGAISGIDDWYSMTVTAGSQIAVSTTTPGGGTGEFMNSLDPAIELYDPNNNFVIGDDNTASDARNAFFTTTAGLTGVYRIRVRGVNGTTGEYVVSATVGALVPPPQVASVIVGDGTTQRSRVDSLTVNFDQVVTLPTNAADAFQLVRQSDSVPVTLAATFSNSPTTSVTITFAGGPVDFGSLADGRYSLTILAAQVTGANGTLDGNSDGTAGDDYLVVGTPANGLYRFFGDSNGDGTVDAIDFLAFRLAFLGASATFDFDSGGDVDGFDFLQFRLRFLQSV